MNSTNEDSGGYIPVGNYGYSVGISVGILLFIAILVIVSYFCNYRERRRRLQSPTFYRSHRESDDVCIGLGIDEAVISSYPKMSYTQATELGSKGTNSTCCAICLGDYNSNDILRLLPECNHYFHVNCIDTWLKLHATCPVCRTSPLPTPLPTPLVEVVPLAPNVRNPSQLLNLLHVL